MKCFQEILYHIHLRNANRMCYCSHIYSIASSSFEEKLAKPEIAVAAVDSSRSFAVTTGQIVAVVVAVPDVISVVASI